ncbi:MAG: glycosyltransferase family 2 protein [Planctomycetota bacterium]
MHAVAIVPAFREEGRVGEVVGRLRAVVSEVLVVDDGSPDGTAAEARGAGARVIVHERNRGKGGALRTGFAWALANGADPVLTLDADGQHLPEEVPRLIACAERTGADVVVGTRRLDPREMPFVRRWTNRTMSAVLSLAAGCRIGDTQSGFRLFRARVLRDVSVTTEGFDLESEILVRAARRGFRIREAEVSTVYGTEKSKIRPIRDTIRFLGLLGRLGV